MIFILSNIKSSCVDGVIAIFRLHGDPSFLARSDEAVSRVLIGTDKAPVLRNFSIECTSYLVEYFQAAGT